MNNVADTLKVYLINQNTGLDCTNVFSLALAFAGIGFGVYQFIISKRWKRLEYLDNIIKRLREEKSLIAATELLDLEYGNINIDGKSFRFEINMLNHALMYHEKEGVAFDHNEMLIRHSFDAFFDFCESINYAVELKMIKYTDVFSSPVAYWLYKVIKKDRQTENAVFIYIRSYGFFGTDNLFTKFQSSTHFQLYDKK